MYAGKERRNRVVALVLAVVLVAGVVLALLATVVQARPAQAAVPPHAAVPAHAGLVSVAPADGAQPSPAPSQIQLTFDDVVSPQFVQISLTRDGEPVETGPPSAARTVVTVPVTGAAGPGAYRLLWQVTGEDGHRVPGESSFSVTGAAGAPAATPRVTPSYKTPQTQPTTFGHPDHLPGLVTAVILLLGGLALLVYEHRRRSRAPEPHDAGTEDRQRIS